MNIANLVSLADLIITEREALLAQWREQVRALPSAAHLAIPTLNDHIPDLIDELATALRSTSDKTIPDKLLEGSPPAHGLQRLRDKFDLEEVVAEYNILRGCLHDVAENHGINLQGKPFHIINRVFDEAIGLAVKTYATQRTLEVQKHQKEHLAFVVHDLRTPLNAIFLAAKVLDRILPAEVKNAEASRMLNALRRNARYLDARIMKVIKENATPEVNAPLELEHRDFDLWALVEALIYDLSPVAETATAQLVNIVPEDLMVYADASLLGRVFQNLISNALKYTPRGDVTIGARVTDEKGGVECWVSDNGTGIPEERLSSIFDKLDAEQEKEGGLGVVKLYIEAHGGQVAVESKQGVGSTFRFTLPGKTADAFDY
jgi:two-component system phosphate regulon sensor histidine kinase PhoR